MFATPRRIERMSPRGRVTRDYASEILTNGRFHSILYPVSGREYVQPQVIFTHRTGNVIFLATLQVGFDSGASRHD